MQIDRLRSTLDDIVGEVWAAFLDVPVACSVADSEPGTDCEFAAILRIAGSWNGFLLLGCGVNVVREAAARMFGKPPEQLAADEMIDTICEIGNLLAGYIKSMLAPGGTVSLPQAVGWLPVVRAANASDSTIVLQKSYLVAQGRIEILMVGDEARPH